MLWIGLGLLLLLATCHCTTFGVASDQVESDSHHFEIRGRDYSGEEDDDTTYHYNRGGQRGGDDDEEDERRGGWGHDDDDDDDKKKKPCHKKDDDKKKPCHDDDEPEEVDWDDSDYGDYKFEFAPEDCTSLEDVRVDFTEPRCNPKDDGKCIEIIKRKCFVLVWGYFKQIPCPPKKKDNHRGHGRYD